MRFVGCFEEENYFAIGVCSELKKGSFIQEKQSRTYSRDSLTFIEAKKKMGMGLGMMMMGMHTLILRLFQDSRIIFTRSMLHNNKNKWEEMLPK